jgi:hypothetical protein
MVERRNASSQASVGGWGPQDTKSKKKDIAKEIPDDVARRIRWYRRLGRRRSSTT